MSMSDPVADMLTHIRNAAMAGNATAKMPVSKLKIAIAQILSDEGYIDNFQVKQEGQHPILDITLRYVGERRKKRSMIEGIRRVSKPGRRVYAGRRRIPRVLSGMGVTIMSTPKGVMTDTRARKLRVGGEILCQVW